MTREEIKNFVIEQKPILRWYNEEDMDEILSISFSECIDLIDKVTATLYTKKEVEKIMENVKMGIARKISPGDITLDIILSLNLNKYIIKK